MHLVEKDHFSTAGSFIECWLIFWVLPRDALQLPCADMRASRTQPRRQAALDGAVKGLGAGTRCLVASLALPHDATCTCAYIDHGIWYAADTDTRTNTRTNTRRPPSRRPHRIPLADGRTHGVLSPRPRAHPWRGAGPHWAISISPRCTGR
jgi:hypothetical protein